MKSGNLTQKMIAARSARFKKFSEILELAPRVIGQNLYLPFRAHAARGFAQYPLCMALENCYGAIAIPGESVSISHGTKLYDNILNSNGPYYPNQVQDIICVDHIAHMKRDIVGCQVLDIACGEGITTNKIFSLTGLPEKYIGVDIVESYNQHVAQLFKRAGCETTIGITEDLTEESFLSNPFWERDRDRNLQLTGFIFGGWLYNYDKNFRLNFLRHFHEKLQPGDCLYIFGDNTQNKTTVELAYADKNFSTWLVNGLDFSFHVLKYTGLDPSWIEYWPHVESTDDGLVSCMDMYNLGIQHLEQGHPVIQGMPDTPGNPLFIIYPGEKIIGGRAYKLREDACVQEHEQTGWQVDQLSFSRVRHPRFAEREINASLWRLERR